MIISFPGKHQESFFKSATQRALEVDREKAAKADAEKATRHGAAEALKLDLSTVGGVPREHYFCLPGAVVVAQVPSAAFLEQNGIAVPTHFNLHEKTRWGICKACSEDYCEHSGRVLDQEITFEGKKAWPIPVGALVQYVPVVACIDPYAMDEELIRSTDCRTYVADGKTSVLPGNVIVAPCKGPSGEKKTPGGLPLPDTYDPDYGAKWGRVRMCADQYLERNGRMHDHVNRPMRNWPLKSGALVRMRPTNPWKDVNAPQEMLVKSNDVEAVIKAEE